MSVRYAVVDTDGRIVKEGSVAFVDVFAQADTAEVAMTRPLPVTQTLYFYDWSSDQFIERPDMALSIDKTGIIADGADVATINSVPVGTWARVRGPTETWRGMIDDGVLEIGSEVSGRIEVLLQHFPERDERIIIKAS